MIGRTFPSRRDFRALVLAPWVPTALLVLIDGTDRALDYGPGYFIGAVMLGLFVGLVMEVFTLLIGIPLVVWLERYLSSFILCALLGAIIAFVPMSLITATAELPDQASSNGIPTIVDGQLTSQGFVDLAYDLATCAAFGALGGATFWWLRRKRPAEADDDN